MAGLTALLLRPYQEPESEHQDAGADLAAGHLLLQRQTILRAHHHRAQQTPEDHTAWGHPILHEVLA